MIFIMTKFVGRIRGQLARESRRSRRYGTLIRMCPYEHEQSERRDIQGVQTELNSCDPISRYLGWQPASPCGNRNHWLCAGFASCKQLGLPVCEQPWACHVL